MASLTFKINYHTHQGEQVYLCGSTPELGLNDEKEALLLDSEGDDWTAVLNINRSTDLQYYYLIREGGTTIRREWGDHRKLHIVRSRRKMIIHDHWKEKPHHAYLYTSPFTESIFKHEIEKRATRYYSRTLLLNVICPYVSREQQLVISGACDALGNWKLERAIPLRCVSNGEWQMMLDAGELPAVTAYKFVIVDKKSGLALHWEEGDNRLLTMIDPFKSNTLVAEMGLSYRHPHFTFRGKGTAIPLFSLRSEKSFGVGDFSDLRKMIDWVALTRQQMIQLLPVNDTTSTATWRDSYPYNAISIYALHPIYLGCGDYPLRERRRMKQYLKRAEALNSLPQLDYERVLALKTDYCRDLFQERGEELLSSDDYNTFYDTNSKWLFPYACYCLLRDRNHSADFRTWEAYNSYDQAQLEQMMERTPAAKRELLFWYFIQFLLHQQFSAAKAYAHSKGVTLKGDIPIGISRESIDAWSNPHLFNMESQSGAPPDDFSLLGQNWGFPTYNWQAMKEEDYRWWISRFRKMADYFDAYRIDHILGFFRIWEIPPDAVQGVLGTFSPALPYRVEEINRAGIPFDEERMAQPYIHEHLLSEIFGDLTGEVKEHYLERKGWQQHRYRLQSFCDTQLKIKECFADRNDEKSILIREGLYTLCAEVLFIRDRHDHHRFHPRITAQYTRSYRYLDNPVKEAFNQLYNEFYYHRHNDLWREQAMEKLPTLINSTTMMACGEDLGMVPDAVPPVIEELQMLSLEIERMPKKSGVMFTDLRKIPSLSVCTTSTHDMSPIRLWWSEHREVTQRYYNEVLHHEGAAPEECHSELCREIIEHHLLSPALWVILPWQDWLSLSQAVRNPDAAAERINIPANAEHFWRYRMHLTLEDLLQQEPLNRLIGRLSRGV